VGAIQAAERYAREPHAAPLRLELDSIADRARIDAHFRRSSTLPPPPPDPSAPASRRSSGATRLWPSLSDEVARILDSSRAERSRTSDEPPRTSPSQAPAPADASTAPKSVRPPSAPAEPLVTPRRSSRPPSGR
jgi:hypothetical protein